jgi:hypothetical protein
VPRSSKWSLSFTTPTEILHTFLSSLIGAIGAIGPARLITCYVMTSLHFV